MEKFKFTLFVVVVLALIGSIGYWSFASLQSGTEYAKDEKIKQLQKENEDLNKQIEALTNGTNSPQPIVVAPAPVVDTKSAPAPTVYEYQDTIDALQKLVSSNVFLKVGSKGATVGTVQNFLNIYNDTSNKADNDYGAGTAQLVSAFQKDSGLSADGQAGKATFNKMIEWLKEQ